MGDKPEILVVGPYPDWDLAPMAEAYRLRRLWEAPDRDAFLRDCADVRAIATRGELGASGALMKALPRLEIVACYGVGTDAIDLEAARAGGIRVTNTPGVLTEDVADMAVALTLATMRRVTAAEAHVRSGRWADGTFELVRRFHGCRLGIAGYGRIGAAVAKRAAGFDVEIAYFDKVAPPGIDHRRFDTLVDLAAWCDVLVVTLAGGPGMGRIVDARVLEALGPEGFLVNVSRGMIVDEAALLDILERRGIAGAGLDVFLGEPRIDPRFATLENVVLQPHHSSGTVETRRAMGQLVRDNLAAHFAGLPLPTPVI